MNTEDFLTLYDYNLPQSYIAHEPVSPRDSSKLLVINRKKKTFSHHHFFQLPEILDKNYLLVFNDTKVYPARLFGKKENGKTIEILLIKQLSDGTWEALCHPGVKGGTTLDFGKFQIQVIALKDKEIIIKPNVSSKEFLSFIEILGNVPIPPYIHTSLPKEELQEKYQTVYAKETGSSAAPTAGLHFTKTLLQNLETKGIEMVNITLHVGLGTFAPIGIEHMQEKKLHTESFEITKEESEKINTAKKSGKKIIAVGTTALRALESATDEKGVIHPFSGDTSIFIYPGYMFRIVDGMVTNFHVPKSSLLMLVSAFCSYPNTKEKFHDFKNSLMGKAYEEAKQNNYRFFSFGDGSLIL